MYLRLAITALCLLAGSAALADAGFHVKRNHHRHRVAERAYHHDHRDQDTQQFARRHHHERDDFNTYSGDVAVYVSPNVGTWSYGGNSSVAVVEPAGPEVRIIDVKAVGNSACAMEAGVCVIRP